MFAVVEKKIILFAHEIKKNRTHGTVMNFQYIEDFKRAFQLLLRESYWIEPNSVHAFNLKKKSLSEFHHL